MAKGLKIYFKLFCLTSGLLLLSTICNGCVPLMIYKVVTPIKDANKLMVSAKYSEVEKYYLEKNVESLSNLDLLNLSLANYKLKKYDKSFKHIELVENKIQQGDIFAYSGAGQFSKIFLTAGLGDTMSIAQLWPSDMTLLPDYLKMLNYFDIANYSKVIELGNKLQKSIVKHNWPLFDITNKQNTLLDHRSKSLLARAYALTGDKENALKLANILFEDKMLGIAEASQIYLILGIYDKVITIDSELQLFRFANKFADIWTGNAFNDNSMANSFVLQHDAGMAKSLLETGKIEAAKEKYDKLLQLDSVKSIGEIYWIMLYDRCRLSSIEGKQTEAIQYCSQAVDVIETYRSSIKTETAKIGFVGNKEQVYNKLVALYMSSQQYTKAFEYIERGKARALVDMLASKKDIAGKTTQKQETTATLTELAQLETATMEAPKENETVAQLVEKKGTRSLKLREKLKQADPEFSSLVTVDKVSIESIQKRLGSDTVLIEYHYLDPDLYIVVVGEKEISGFVENAPGLADKVLAFRKTIQDFKSTEYLALSTELYQKLIAPASAAIKARNIVFVPHGALHYLPFAALKNQDAYLVDTYSISYLPSASVLEFLRNRKTADPEILIFGNPDLNNSEHDLKFAEQEAQTISGEFAKSRLLTRKMASKSAFMENAGKFSLIHIASHGYFNSESPLASGLYLSPSGGDDGVLSVSELYSTEINADLVTLSACETGLGKIVNGDDVVGLTRGFLYAGTSNIVASLWKVDDLATSDLMQGFYKNMKTMPKREALQNAQQLVKAKYKHPFYWAAFEITGSGI